MRTRCLPVMWAVMIAACASWPTLTPQQKTLRILDDAGWGIAAACSEEWLSANQCIIAEDILTAARAAAGNNPQAALPAAQRVIADFDMKLPADSRLHAFFQYILKISL